MSAKKIDGGDSEVRHSGWAMVLKRERDAHEEKKRWVRRYLEVSFGSLCVFATTAGVSLEIDSMSNASINIDMIDGCTSELKIKGKDASSKEFHLRASNAIVREIMNRILAPSDEDESSSFSSHPVTLMPSKKPGVLTFTGGNILGLHDKKLKKSFMLHGVEVETLESGGQHRLVVTNSQNESIALTVPEPLSLLQWVREIAGCDVEPKAEKTSELSDAVNKLVFEEAKRNSGFNFENMEGESPAKLKRTYTLGVGKTLG